MEKLSKYRTELMGFGILWIVLFHSKINFIGIFSPLNYFKNLGYIGVEFFFILSGLGLCFSWYKKKSLISFYQKRFIRIIPTYWLFLLLINIPNIINQKLNFKQFFLEMFGLQFLLYGSFINWFIPSIIICYLVFPLIIKLIEKSELSVVLAYLFFITLSMLLAWTNIVYLVIFIIRLPVFILGVYIGYFLIHKKQFILLENIYFNLFIFIISLVYLFFIFLNFDNQIKNDTGLVLYPSVFMALPLSLFIVNFFEKILQFPPFFLYIFNIFGVYSLEIYLMHNIIINNPLNLSKFNLDFNLMMIIQYLYLIFASLLISILFNKSINYLFLKCSKILT